MIDLSNTIAYPRLIGVPTARVWTKSAWADPFVLRPDLVPIQTTSSVSPDVPTATLEYRYGRVLLPGATNVVDLVPITGRGYWVLIEWVFGSSEWWLGYAETPVTTRLRAASGLVPAAGIQRVPCYGLERILQITPVTSTVHRNPDSEAEQQTLRNPLGSVFNPQQFGNRDNSENIFASPDAPATKWTARQIVSHLLSYHLPTPSGEAGSMPWAAPDLTAIPDWEEPTIETDQRTLAEIFDELISPGRMLGWRLVPVIAAGSPPTVTAINFTPFSRAASPITLPDIGTMPANAAIETVTGADTDPLTDAEITEDAADIVDQVIVYGPREIGVCTLAFGSELEKDWTSAAETEYTEGASNEAGYGALKQYEQRKRDQEIRSRPGARSVFRDVRLAYEWDGLVDSTDNVFLPNADDSTYVPFLFNAEILPDLPLYEGVDYEGDPALVDESGWQTNRPPLVMLEQPDNPTFYESVDRLGSLTAGLPADTAGVSFAVEARPWNGFSPGLQLAVSAGPQHAIAGPGFTGTAADVDQSGFGGYDYTTLRATVAILGDRRPFYAIPADEDLAAADVIRRRVIVMEDATLQHVHIAAATIVSLDSQGDPIYSDGGILRDPAAKLEALARLLAASLTQSSKRVEIRTSRRLPLAAGGMIGSIDGQSTGATILEVRIDAPVSEQGSQPQPATVSITAATHRVDILGLLKARR